MNCAYFDHAATTKPHPLVIQAVTNALEQQWINPSGSYRPALDVTLSLRQVKEDLAAFLGADREEFYFTSGGTEANNLALRGAFAAKQRRGKHIITSKAEHSSVLETVKQLEQEGAEVTFLPVDKQGAVSLEDLKQALRPDTVLASLMMTNNETGAIHSIGQMVGLVRKVSPLAHFHCDLVAAFGKQSIHLHKLDLDSASFSAHKIHGPKGCGVLYLKKGARILPQLFGGEQQKKLRPGTEATPLIFGLGAAVALRKQEMEEETVYVGNLRRRALELIATHPEFTVHSPEDGSPYLLNFSTNRVKSETMLHGLDQAGYLISAGSACAGGKKSHVLSAMPISDRQADSALRISFSKENSAEELEGLLNELFSLCERLQNAWKGPVI